MDAISNPAFSLSCLIGAAKSICGAASLPADLSATPGARDGGCIPAFVGTVLLLQLQRTVTEPTQRYLQALLDARLSPTWRAGASEAAARRSLRSALEGLAGGVFMREGRPLEAPEGLKAAGITDAARADVDFDALEAQLDISGAVAVHVYDAAHRLFKGADICAAMTLEGIRGETGAFDARLHELGRPYPGQIAAARNVRRIVADSAFTTEDARMEFGGDTGPRCQDAISIRAVPQTHGGGRDALAWFAATLEGSLQQSVASRDMTLDYALDLLAIGLIDLAVISERRSFRMLDTRMSYGLPMNLVAENPGFNHGFPVIQAAAAAVVAEMKLKAPKGRGQGSFSALTGRYVPRGLTTGNKLVELMDLLGKVLAIELFMASQAMDLTHRTLPNRAFGAGSAPALATTRQHLPMVLQNRFASDDMNVAEWLIVQGTIVRAVEDAIGRLD